jgi:uncharacterized integral membrane protein (TIGR00698 family)
MAFGSQTIRFTLNGILFVVLFSVAAVQISDLRIFKRLGLSPLIVGIVIGMIYANTLRGHLPVEWVPGILFSSKTLLRVAIVFYGFRITFQQIAGVGLEGLTVSGVMLISTFVLGSVLGRQVFGLDRDTSLLIGAGSAVCGAAAVLATEPVLKSEPYKSAIAVATVVLFGTASMFLYPALFHTGILAMTPQQFGFYAGSTIHEVAQVVGAATAVNDAAANVAVIVKLTRVMMIAPLLLILGVIVSAGRGSSGPKRKLTAVVPWFAVLFIVMSGVHSLGVVPAGMVEAVNTADTFLLTMAMTALGMETEAAKFKKAGIKPLLLAAVLFVWLTVGGFFVTKAVASL